MNTITMPNIKPSIKCTALYKETMELVNEYNSLIEESVVGAGTRKLTILKKENKYLDMNYKYSDIALIIGLVESDKIVSHKESKEEVVFTIVNDKMYRMGETIITNVNKMMNEEQEISLALNINKEVIKGNITIQEAHKVMRTLKIDKIIFNVSEEILNYKELQMPCKNHSIGGLKRAAKRSRKQLKKELGYKATSLVNGNFVINESKNITKKIKNKVKPANVVNTQPKGIATPKMPKHKRDISLIKERLAEIKDSSKLILLNSLDNKIAISEMAMTTTGSASGSGSTSTNNNTGGNNMNIPVNVLSNIKGFNFDNRHNVISKKFYDLKETMDLEIVSISLSKDKDSGKERISVSLTKAPTNSFTRDINFSTNPEKQKIKVGQRFKTYDKNTLVDRYLLVSSSKEFVDSSLGDIYIDMVRGVYAIKLMDGTYTNMTTGKNIKKPEKLIRYSMLFATAAGLRGDKVQHHKAIFCKNEDGLAPEKLQNKYVYNISAHSNTKMTKSEAMKFFNRAAQQWTDNWAISEVKCFGHYKGTFGINRTLDGISFIRASKVAKDFNITEEEAVLLNFQIRPGTLKVQGYVLSNKTFDLLVEYLKETGLTIIGKGAIEVLYDNNGYKAICDIEGATLNLLKVGKLSEIGFSKTLLEKAFLQSAIDDRENGTNTYEDFSEYISDLAHEAVRDRLQGLVDIEDEIHGEQNFVYDLINKGKNSVPACKISMLENNILSIANQIDRMKFLPREEDGKMYYVVAMVDLAILFGTNILEKNEVYIGSENLRNKHKGQKVLVTKYPQMDLGEQLSAKVASKKTIINRIKRLKINSKLENGIKDALIDFYTNMPECTLVFPAYEEVLDNIADMDIDFDQNVISFNKPYLDIMWGKDRKVDIIKSTKDKQASKGKVKHGGLTGKVTYSLPRDNYTIFKKIVKHTQDVGVISNGNSKYLAARTLDLRGDSKGIDLILAESAASLKDIESFEKTIDELPCENGIRVISNDIIKQLLSSMYKSLTPVQYDNLKDAMLSASKVYQGAAIDAVKTALMLDIYFLTNSVKLASLVKIIVGEKHTNEKEGTVTFKIKRKDLQLKERKLKMVENGKIVEKTMTPYLMVDEISIIQDSLIEYVNDLVENDLKETAFYEFTTINDEGIRIPCEDDLNKYMGLLKRSPETYKQLKMIRSFYSSFASEYGKLMSIIPNDEQNEATREAQRNYFKENCESTANSLRRILDKDKSLSNLTMYGVGAILTALAATPGSKSSISPTSSNKFALNLAPEYVLAYALETDEYIRTHEVLGYNPDFMGQDIELVKGISENLVVKSRFKDRPDRKATVTLTTDKNGKAIAVEKVAIDYVPVDETMATIIADVETSAMVDDKGIPVLDSFGAQRYTIMDPEGARGYKYLYDNIDDVKVIKQQSKGRVVFNVRNVDKDGEYIKFALSIKDIPFNDLQDNVVYTAVKAVYTRDNNGKGIIAFTFKTSK